MEEKKYLPKWLWISVLVILLLGGIGLAYWIYKTDVFSDLTQVAKVSPSPSKDLNDTPCPLDGVMTTKERAERRPLGIMIENHPDARPQSGLDKASFIFETPSEGGITRFLVFFVENDAQEVGPVRSARTYYVDWADEVRAIYVHAGGSAIALKNLANDKYLCNINHDQDHFWRDNSRFAPHNLYTTTDKIREAASIAKCSLKADYQGYEFKDDVAKEEQGTTKIITVNFSSAQFQVVYNYDPEKNVYLRSQAGTAHKDKITGAQLSPKTVVVMHADRVTSASDGTQQSHAVTTGTGKAEIYLDGKEIVGTWKRASISDRTIFYDELGKEIIFNRGQIWVEVLSPTGNAISS
ncbi:MAG: hypothetical protein CEN92_18 [Candidatus Berkelbacteria bacterium Licking1014_96]|uniref:DUF3048 domain-containing protein n=1 Tax=Candidatus Berkelbacteria bacterium Licking1014_96 TaxID=2017149 RepID=A0A554LHK0_9BACT|nr:MAG: hypothetical protein CEN92_18 [Candidatus Berkelbacteria bacterium Licking1014_96]